MRKNRITILSKRLIKFTLIAISVGVLSFIIMSTTGIVFQDKIFDVEKRENLTRSLYEKSFKNYIQRENITLDKIEKLADWEREIDNAFIKVFYKGRIVYDSLYGAVENGTESEEKIKNYKEATPFTIKIGNENVDVLMFSYDDTIEKQIYAVSVIGGFGIFIIVLLIMIEYKIRYVNRIRKDILLISENLDYEATVKGDDELTDVAIGINAMRRAVIKKIEDEKIAYKANTKLIKHLSHDIKTPMTSLIGYLELANKFDSNDEKRKEYIDIAYNKALEITEIANKLMEHFTLHSGEMKMIIEVRSVKDAIIEPLKKQIREIEEKGGKVYKEIDENIGTSIGVNQVMVNSVFNNVFSNLIKYADLNKEISIKVYENHDCVNVLIKNYKKEVYNVESNNIGLKNCKMIMKAHRGYFKVIEEKNTFQVNIIFI